MAYGTATDIDNIEEYYRDILGGRTPSPELLADLKARYRAIGGSPLLSITKAQASGIEARLPGVKAYLGQKHAAPFVEDAVEGMASDDIEEAVGLVLAPHYSTMSIGEYENRARRAGEKAGWNGELRMVESWHLEDGYLDFLAREVKLALDGLSERAREGAVVVFSAHSLPARILEENDPYPDQLGATAEAVAQRSGLARWEIGWQSAGRSREPWLGPDITEMLAELAEAGGRGVVVCPCGFVADHLEILYDIDIEAKGVAESLGLELVRTRMPNDDPGLLDALAGVVARQFRAR
jgi:protoporphyrin/coproporphyrin ferrochelatase